MMNVSIGQGFLPVQATNGFSAGSKVNVGGRGDAETNFKRSLAENSREVEKPDLTREDQTQNIEQVGRQKDNNEVRTTTRSDSDQPQKNSDPKAGSDSKIEASKQQPVSTADQSKSTAGQEVSGLKAQVATYGPTSNARAPAQVEPSSLFGRTEGNSSSVVPSENVTQKPLATVPIGENVSIEKLPVSPQAIPRSTLPGFVLQVKQAEASVAGSKVEAKVNSVVEQTVNKASGQQLVSGTQSQVMAKVFTPASTVSPVDQTTIRSELSGNLPSNSENQTTAQTTTDTSHFNRTDVQTAGTQQQPGLTNQASQLIASYNAKPQAMPQAMPAAMLQSQFAEQQVLPKTELFNQVTFAKPEVVRPVRNDEPASKRQQAVKAEGVKAAQEEATEPIERRVQGAENQNRPEQRPAQQEPAVGQMKIVTPTGKEAVFQVETAKESPTGSNVGQAQTADRPSYVFANRDQIFNQVQERIVSQAQKGGGKVNLTLHPKELGRLSVEIRMTEGLMKTHIIAEDPLVREVLLRQQGELKNSLENMGLKLDEFTVTVREDQNRQGFNSMTGDSSDEGETNRLNQKSRLNNGEIESTDAQTRRYIRPEALVDLVV